MVRLATVPTATSVGPGICIMPTKDWRTSATGASQGLGRGICAARSRKAFTNGSSGRGPLCLATNANAQTGTLGSVKRQALFGGDAAGIDVAQQDQHQEPELGALVAAFGFQGHDRTAGIIAGGRAVFGGQIGGETIQLWGRHP